jgi:hypothetical protein
MSRRHRKPRWNNPPTDAQRLAIPRGDFSFLGPQSPAERERMNKIADWVSDIRALMPWSSLQILSNAATPQRSVIVGSGYLPGRQLTLALTGFSGSIDLQTSMDGGESWYNCQYLVNNAGNPTNATLTYTNSTGEFSFKPWSNNLLFSVSLSSVTAGSVTATYWSGDAPNLPQNPA